MAAIGGSPETITLDGREFPVTADADPTLKLGGYENEMGANGDSSSRLLKTRMPGSLTGCVVECDTARDDHEFLNEFTKNQDFRPVTITLVDGSIYQANGAIVGELSQNFQNATCGFDIGAAGEFTKQ